MLLVPLVASAALLASACTQGSPTTQPTPSSAGNGLESKSADEIFDAARQAMSDADSFRVSGEGGQAPLTYKLNLTLANDDVDGTMTVLGVDVKVKKVADTLYVNADASFWAGALGQFLTNATEAQLNLLAAQLASGWASAPAALVAGVIPVPLTVDSLFGADAVPTPLTKGDTKELNGKPVIEITDADGSVFSIALEGEPYILQIVTGGEPVTFSDFNKPVTIEKPAQSFDLLQALNMG